MKAEVRHFFETATDREKMQAKAWCNHKLGRIMREKANAARRQELGCEESEDEQCQM